MLVMRRTAKMAIDKALKWMLNISIGVYTLSAIIEIIKTVFK